MQNSLPSLFYLWHLWNGKSLQKALQDIENKSNDINFIKSVAFDIMYNTKSFHVSLSPSNDIDIVFKYVYVINEQKTVGGREEKWWFPIIISQFQAWHFSISYVSSCMLTLSIHSNQIPWVDASVCIVHRVVLGWYGKWWLKQHKLSNSHESGGGAVLVYFKVDAIAIDRYAMWMFLTLGKIIYVCLHCI